MADTPKVWTEEEVAEIAEIYQRTKADPMIRALSDMLLDEFIAKHPELAIVRKAKGNG